MRLLKPILLVYAAALVVVSAITVMFGRTPMQAYQLGSLTKPAVLFSFPGNGDRLSTDLVQNGTKLPRDPRYAPGDVKFANTTHFVFLISSKPDPTQDALIKKLGFTDENIQKTRNENVSVTKSKRFTGVHLDPFPVKVTNTSLMLFNIDWISSTYRPDCHVGILQDIGFATFRNKNWEDCKR